jgi:hypothetical protein
MSVVLQFSGSTTPIGTIGTIAPHLLVVFNCKMNLNFETLNTTNRCGAATKLQHHTYSIDYTYCTQCTSVLECRAGTS